VSEVTTEEIIRNKYETFIICVASIVDKTRVNKLIKHKIKRQYTKAVRVVMKIDVEGKRGRERQRRDDWVRLRMIQGLLVCA